MKVLVTGAKGFLGRNLITELRNRGYIDIFEYDVETDFTLLDYFCKEAEFIFHLAGVNRPLNQSKYMEVNYGLTKILLDLLIKHNNKSPIMMSSSIQAEQDNPYGLSKKAGEDLLLDYNKRTGVKIYIFRFQNIFGKWCKPNYNSVIATFCYNIANDLPIQINDSQTILNLVYIDDVVDSVISAMITTKFQNEIYCSVNEFYIISLEEIVKLIVSFKKSRENLSIPNMADPFTKKLYSTYLSYLPKDKFNYELKMNIDYRGSFTEFIKTFGMGQISINITKPGLKKGDHWHNLKVEKFLVVAGSGVVRFKRIDEEEVLEYFVDGSKLIVIDIPVGYTHNIENLGETELVTVMWVSESFNSDKPDTYYLEV